MHEEDEAKIKFSEGGLAHRNIAEVPAVTVTATDRKCHTTNYGT